MRMDGERRAWRRTAAVAGLMAIFAAGAAQADSPGPVKYRTTSALTGSTGPVYDAVGRSSGPIYSPGDRPAVAAPLATGPIYNPGPIGTLSTGSTGGLSTGPIYNPAPLYAPAPQPSYQPSYAPVAYTPPPPQPPAYAKQNDLFGYAPSAACGGLLEGERCLVILGDHTRRVKLDREAATILVGNPAIADVTVLSKRTMFVSARSVGSTNIVALDEDENEIASWEVFVREPEAKRVTLRQGPTRENYQCAPYCERSLSQNDSPGAHSSHMGVISAEMGLDQRAVGVQSGGAPEDAFQGRAPAQPAAPAAAQPAAPAAASPADSAAAIGALQAMFGLTGLQSNAGGGLSPGPAAAPLATDAPPPDYVLR